MELRVSNSFSADRCIATILTLALNFSLVQDECGSWMEIFAKPADTQDCDGNHPCHNLLEYISYPQCYFTSNTTIRFLPGLHLLEQNITVLGVKNLELVGGSVNGTKDPNAIIHCNGTQAGLIFKNITNFKIQKIMIVNCGRSLPSNIWTPYTLKKTTVFAALFVANVHMLTIEGVHIEASTGYGLLGLNVFGNSVVINSKFYCNNNVNVSIDCYNQIQSKTTGGNISRIGGNAYFVFIGEKKIGAFVECNLEITGSNFSHGRSESEGGGLGILIIKLGGITVNVSNCTFENNVAHSGANGFICIERNACYFCRGNHIRVIITKCNFIGGRGRHAGGGLCIKSNNSSFLHIDIWHSNFSNNSGSKGGGIDFEMTNTNSFYIQILDTTFSRNIASAGGGIFLLIKSNMQVPFFSSHLYSPVAHVKTQVFVTNCSFRECQASTGAAVRIDNCYFEEVLLYLIEYCKPSGLETLTVFKNVVFSNNRGHQRPLSFSTNAILFAAVLHLFNVNQLTLNNLQFKNNLCGSIYALSSKITCKGHLEFHNNEAYEGGAFNLDCNSNRDPSLIYLYPESKLYMSNNSAKYGGAIAAREDCSGSEMHVHMCFFQPTWFGSLPEWKMPKVILKNNTATIEGNSIYVRNVYICSLQFTRLHPSTFWSIFTVYGVNQIVEHAYKVCFCLDSYAGSLPEWMMEDTCPHYNAVTVYRGKSFNATVAGIGQYNYPIPTVLQTSIESESGSARLGIRQHAQELSYSCTNVTYSITSIENEVTLFLSIENTIPFNNFIVSVKPAKLKVTLIPCPFGFEFVGMPPTCGCAGSLRHTAGISCDVDTTLIHHPPSMWIGKYSGRNTIIIVVHRNCPLDYCKPARTHVNISNPDEQCAFSHAGVLCGACQPGLSLALGTSQCLQCSNVYLLLLIPFALAGVALVFLLLKCNLTVSVGTINGLIFYANVVKVNHAIFFPHGDTNLFTDILSVFISWLNLDLGIETCFFSGMDSYIKTWLQFLFPLYIWVMVATMILTSRYSTNIARLTGSNAVPVLATLFLLSYAKLLRTVIAATLFTSLSVENGTIQNVWLLDGNIAFLRGHHIALFLAGIVTVFGYILPFTALVTLSPFLQAHSGYKLLRWVSKLKPFLDAYHGPYRDKFRYWTGLMLVFRLVLLAIFAGNALGDPRINLFATIMMTFLIMIYCWNVGNVYKNRILNILESFLILNLGTFATASMFLKAFQTSSQIKQEVLTCVMVGSVFILSCTILLYHLLQQLRGKGLPHWVLRQFRKIKVEREHQSSCTSEGSPGPPSPQHPPTVTTVELGQLREPLLSENL